MWVLEVDEEGQNLGKLVAKERRRGSIGGQHEGEEGGAEQGKVIVEDKAAAQEGVMEGLEASKVDVGVRQGGEAGEAETEE